MALRWLLHSACHVLGNPNETDIHPNEQQQQEAINGGKSSKVVVAPSNGGLSSKDNSMDWCPSGFQMPLHYPRYKKADYEKMEEWKVDMLLREYGLNFKGTLQEKREFAMGAFLWPDQY